MPKKLPPNASFRSVVSTLPDARRYFANVYQIMLKSEKAHGTTLARIGVTGTGVMPNFRVEAEAGSYKQAFDGLRFVPFTEPNTRDVNWSTCAAPTAEMKELVEEQAVIERKKPR